MTKLYIDIETYSEVDLKKSNAYRYAADPSFMILMAAWAIDDDPVQVAIGHDEIGAIPLLWDTEEVVIKVAHNAPFERVCFSNFGGWDTQNGSFMPPEEWDDTMARAGEHGYPMTLKDLAIWLGGEQKDEAGTRLINMFCKPNRKGERTLPEEKPEEWAAFVEYCRQDVETLRSIDKQLPDWPTEFERQAWLTDQRINDRGILVDVALAEAAVETSDTNAMMHELEFTQITGVANPNSRMQVMAWFESQGFPLKDLTADTVATALAGDIPTPEARRALEIRQELALVASKKYIAALDRVQTDNRLRGSFQFFGAHTGRWAGRGVQLQNLPAATVPADIPEGVSEEVAGRLQDAAIGAAALDVTMGLGADAETLKALVRSMFLGPFTVADYSAIEARVVAWLADEQWALDAFAAGRDIYVETAERMGGLTRKEGKVAVLALGYNGGIGSLDAMGASGSRSYLQGLVDQWRGANPRIVNLWAEMDAAFWVGDRAVGDRVYVERDGDDRLLVLPSGRAITYHGVKRQWKENRWGNTSPQLSFKDPKRSPYRMDTYGGRLVENITQAVARDVLTDALVRLDAAGYKPVGHVHDEILVEGDVSLDDVVAIMTENPAWADGLPLDAEGYTCPRYRKG